MPRSIKCFVFIVFHLPAYRQQLLSWCIWSQHSTELPKACSKCLHPSIGGCNPGKTAFNPAGKECVLLGNGGTLNRKCCFNVRMGWHIWREPGPPDLMTLGWKSNYFLRSLHVPNLTTEQVVPCVCRPPPPVSLVQVNISLKEVID